MEKTTNELINRYKEQLSFFENLILNTKDETFKNCYLVIAKELCVLEKTDLKIYEENIKNLETKFREPQSDKSSLEETEKKVEKPKENEEVDKLEEDKLENKNNEEEINEDKAKTEDLEMPKEDNKKTESLDDYVFKNIYMSKDEEMKDKFQKLFLTLQDILPTSNEEKIKNWVKEYISFTDKYSSLDKEILINFMKKSFERYDKKKEFVGNIDEYLKEEKTVKVEKKVEETKKEDIKIETNESIDKTSEKPLKIINIKKSHKLGLDSLKVLAMIGIGVTTGLGGLLSSYVIYKLAKKGFKSQKFNSLLEKYGYKIVNDELIDKDGNKVTNEKVEKEKVGFFKQKLMNLNKYKDNGMFKKSYKKNRITSMLLNMKLVDSIKKRFKFNNSEDAPIIQNEEYKKGMGKC